ncbi:sulfite exporter TauE/SafE family protein [Candidatus Magnetaquicoccus inordinatus]|uniref:sulfite exporter TauE/SafE family protein n=1 Tax=Candidatus Magnetaquicoccus inordinatus TaxID=2496818 RepID=UPI00102BFD39|nr:sulfite exporter TauE/SafE family protein [Candidatus Magnetaquicoccus inordinatus]
MPSPSIEPLVIGLFSTVHCLVMCGGIVAALTVSLPVAVRRDPQQLLAYLLAYHAGRIISYAMAGLLAGLLGEAVVNLLNLGPAHANFLYLINSLILLGMGLYVAGWLPGVAWLEHLGARVWSHIEPFAQRLLPVQTHGHALLFGGLWGWFPCGLTYSVLLWAAVSGDMLKGALAMSAFGMGTLPGLFMASFFSGHLTRWRQHRLVKKILGVGIILLAFSAGFTHPPPVASQEHHHHSHTENLP